MPSDLPSPVLTLLATLGLPAYDAAEGQRVEFKAAQGGIPQDMWETISAFANSRGGWIVLGIRESGGTFVYEGVDNAEAKLKQIHDLLRNPEKVSRAVCGDDDVRVVHAAGVVDRPVIVVHVPEQPRRQRPVYVNNNPKLGTYVRRHTGDHRCDEAELARMYREAGHDAGDSEIIPGFGMGDLDASALQNYRRRFQNLHPESARNAYGDVEFLRALGAYRRDRQSGTEGLTVAGLLLFGAPEAIREYRDPHRIDFRVVTSEEGRWDDRLLWEGNLLEGYFEGFRRLAADLPVRFRLQGDVRTSETPAHTALREALVNALVHADYAERDATLIVRSPEGFVFRNPGSSRLATADLRAGDRSDPRNPTLVRAFREIGLAEEAGTGIRSIRRAWRELGYAEPGLDAGTASDRYEFRLELPYVYLVSEEDRVWLASLGESVTEAEALALVQARHSGYVDNQSLRLVTGQHPADTTRVLSSLAGRELLRLQGAGRGAYYELGTAALAGAHSARGAARSVAGPAELPQLWAELRAIAEPVRSRARVLPAVRDEVLVRLCRVLPLSLPELAGLLGRKETGLREPIRALLERGSLDYLHPENPNHPKQKYVATGPG